MIRNAIFDRSGKLVDDPPAMLPAADYVMRRAGLSKIMLSQFRGRAFREAQDPVIERSRRKTV